MDSHPRLAAVIAVRAVVAGAPERRPVARELRREGEVVTIE